MTVRVYQFRLDPPTQGEREVRMQLASAHRYRNDLVAIERGRRAALRAVHDVPEVLEAEAVLRDATRSTRRAAVKALWDARRQAEKRASTADETAPDLAAALAAVAALPADCKPAIRSAARRALKVARAAAGDELARISLLDEEIRRGARELATCHWGTYLSVEASADQARKAPLYADDHRTPAEPRFLRGGANRYVPEDDARSVWWCRPSQVGMHVQGRVCRTSDALSGRDAWVRLEDVEPIDRPKAHQQVRRATLALRIDRDTWARWPIRIHRELPDAAHWSWVRVSCRPQQGAFGRERWSVEITLDDPARPARELSASQLRGALAVELCWSPPGDDGSMLVGRWLDSDGQRGELRLPRKLVRGLGEVPAGIQSVRDLVLNEMRPKLARALRECGEPLPAWLSRACATLNLWQKPGRFHDLVRMWRSARCDAARGAYEILDAWAERDTHLDDYEDGTRARSLRWRREIYRTQAAAWARVYESVIVPDRDLSREARYGTESELRFLASPQELRDCLRRACGAEDAPWRGPHGVIDDGEEDSDVPEWLEMAVGRWRERSRDEQTPVDARDAGKASGNERVRGGAWARRQRKAAERDLERGAARKVAGNAAE